MSPVRPLPAGLAFALFGVAAHAGWSLLVFLGWAQPLIDLVFRLHMLKPIVQVAPFAWSTAAGLLVYAAIAGFLFGAVLAAFWNGLSRLAAPRERAPRPVSVH